MSDSKLEQFVKANDLVCEIHITKSGSMVSLQEKDSLYIRFFKSDKLNDAINKAVNHYRKEASNESESMWRGI